MIQQTAPIALGAIIGWMLYYFMRKYKIFSSKTLAATITAFLGGELISVLHKASGETISIDLWYFLGVGIGFLPMQFMLAHYQFYMLRER